MCSHIRKRNLKSQVAQVLRCFHPDKPSTDNHCPPRFLLGNESFNRIGVGQALERKIRQLAQFFNRRDNRRRTGCDNQLVVCVNAVVRGLYFFLAGDDFRNRAICFKRDVKQIRQNRSRRHLHFFALGDNSADKIRQPAVGNGNLAAFFQNRDFRLVVKPPQSCRAA